MQSVALFLTFLARRTGKLLITLSAFFDDRKIRIYNATSFRPRNLYHTIVHNCSRHIFVPTQLKLNSLFVSSYSDRSVIRTDQLFPRDKPRRPIRLRKWGWCAKLFRSSNHHRWNHYRHGGNGAGHRPRVSVAHEHHYHRWDGAWSHCIAEAIDHTDHINYANDLPPGVGDADFSAMSILDGDGDRLKSGREIASRDIVQVTDDRVIPVDSRRIRSESPTFPYL